MDFLKKLFGVEEKNNPIVIDREVLARKREAEIKRQIALLGEKYLLHPNNAVQKKPVVDERYAKY